MNVKNYGFVPPHIQVEEYVLGANTELPKENLCPDGQWGASTPLYEPQAEKYETWGCTVWGSENQAETYMKRKFGFEPNFDEGFIYNFVGIEEPGANPQDVYETIRKNGLIANRSLPETYNEFKKRPVQESLIKEGKKWLEQYAFKHAWLFFPTADLEYKKQQIIDNLPHSPLGVSVVAWKERDGKYWKNIGEQDTHWCELFGYVKGEYWLIFDSYDHSIKKLEWNYDFGFCKRIYIERKEPKEYQSWFVKNFFCRK